MFKWISLVASFLIGRMNGPNKGLSFSLREVTMEILSGITQRGRRYVSLSLLGFGAVIFTCAGFLIALLNATSQWDRTGRILFTSTFGAGFFLTLCSIGAFVYIFRREWPRAINRPHLGERIREDLHMHGHAPRASNIEQAISALIMDFVRERENKRDARHDAEHPEDHMSRSERRQRERAEKAERDLREQREERARRDEPTSYPH
jgi:sarcosine oxidase delta subunit